VNTGNRKSNRTASRSETAVQKDTYVPRLLLPEANRVKSLLLEYGFFSDCYETRKRVRVKKMRNLRLQYKAVEKEFDTKRGYFASLSLQSEYIQEN